MSGCRRQFADRHQLITDLGISQNIVYSRNAEDLIFTIRPGPFRLRAGVPLACSVRGHSAGGAYCKPQFAVRYAGCVVHPWCGFTPISGFLLQRRLKVARLNVFEIWC